MKIYTEKQKDKKCQKINQQKLSFLYLPIPADLQIKQRVSQHLCDYHKNYDEKQYTTNKRKKTQQTTMINPNTQDTQSTKQFTRYQNHLSTQTLLLPPNPHPSTHLKTTPSNIRQSQNIYSYQNMAKTPTHSCIDKTSPSIKSTFTFTSSSNIQPNTPKSTLLSQSLDQQQNNECKQIKDLLYKIYQIQQYNQKIKQQNIKLRLIKLSTHSQSINMLTLKLQIFDLKKKIQKLSSQQTQQHHYQSLQNSTHQPSNHKKIKQQNQNQQNYLHTSPQIHKHRPSQINQRNKSIGKINQCIHSYNIYNSQSPSNTIKKYNTQSPTFIRNKKQNDLLTSSNKIE